MQLTIPDNSAIPLLDGGRQSFARLEFCGRACAMSQATRILQLVRTFSNDFQERQAPPLLLLSLRRLNEACPTAE